MYLGSILVFISLFLIETIQLSHDSVGMGKKD
jgi:hypothetical protein